MKISFKKMINGEFDTANLSCNSTNQSSSQCLVYCSLLSSAQHCSARTNRVTNILEKIGKCTHKISAVNHPEVRKDILNIDFQFLTHLNTILDWRVSLKQSIDVLIKI